MVGGIVVRTAMAGHIENLSFWEKMVKNSIVMTPRHKQQYRTYHYANQSTAVATFLPQFTQCSQALWYLLGLSGVVRDIAHKGQQQLQGRAAVPAGAVPHEHLDGVVDPGLCGQLGSRRGSCSEDMGVAFRMLPRALGLTKCQSSCSSVWATALLRLLQSTIAHADTDHTSRDTVQ
jgi:hypothetical protein